MSCHVISRLSCHVISRLLTCVTSCHVMSCHVMSRHLARESCSRIFLPSLLNSSIMAAGWPRRGFRNRGPVRESGSERRSRWRRVHCERVRGPRAHFSDLGIVLRGRLRESCVLEVCWERARGMPAALCRGDWVPGGFFCAHGQGAFRVAGCGDRVAGSVSGACPRAVSAAPCRGDWVPGVSRARMILRAATCVSRGRCGTSDALMCSGRHWMVDPRGRRNESCAVGKNAGFRGPVRQSACAGARWALRNRGRRRESVDLRMGAGSGRFLDAAAGCVGRVGHSALCRGTQWQAVTMGVGRAARVARAALCHGDCCWACRLGAAVPWGLLRRLGGAVSLGLVTRASSGWRRVIGIADEGVVWVARH